MTIWLCTLATYHHLVWVAKPLSRLGLQDSFHRGCTRNSLSHVREMDSGTALGEAAQSCPSNITTGQCLIVTAPSFPAKAPPVNFTCTWLRRLWESNQEHNIEMSALTQSRCRSASQDALPVAWSGDRRCDHIFWARMPCFARVTIFYFLQPHKGGFSGI